MRVGVERLHFIAAHVSIRGDSHCAGGDDVSDRRRDWRVGAGGGRVPNRLGGTLSVCLREERVRVRMKREKKRKEQKEKNETKKKGNTYFFSPPTVASRRVAGEESVPTHFWPPQWPPLQQYKSTTPHHTRQDKTRQDKTRQDKTRQEGTNETNTRGLV